ncbi:MAG: phage tail protein [Alphaproteobacteria bacterium]|nr:phage tail protein [Alphaproteobacteria bacterium]
MLKLRSARDHLLSSPLGLKAEKLLTFAERGQVTAHRGDRGQAFEITYTAHLIVTDYTGAPEDLLFVALQWLQAHCPGAEADAIKFHVDLISHKSADVSLSLDLTEIIAAHTDEAGATRLAPQADADALAIDMGNLYPDLPG